VPAVQVHKFLSWKSFFHMFMLSERAVFVNVCEHMVTDSKAESR